MGRDDPHPAFTFAAVPVGQQKLLQRQVNHLLPLRPNPTHQGQIGFVGRAFAKLGLQVLQRAALFGHQQNARCLPVQSVNQLKFTGMGHGLANLLNDAKAHPTAAVHRQAGGFVDRDEVGILQHHVKITLGHGGQGFFQDPSGYPDRGQAHHVIGGQTGVRRSTPFVDPHFTRADDAINMGFGHTFEVADQKVVQPLTRRFLIDPQGLDLWRYRCVGCAYNVVHQRFVPSA